MLAGPQGTPYAEGVWKLHLKMPLDYPKSPPKAAFRTKIYHPNVEEATGSVCLDTLKRDWQPKLTLRDILVTIACLLINPNPDSALNSEAGKLLQEDFDSFARKARLMTSIHARIPPNLKAAVADARTRGEEKPKQRIKIFESGDQSDVEDDESSASKENDPSISPSPVSPPPTLPVRRNTVLGKRPLSDLPTPEEPPSEDEQQRGLSASEKNIVANTPNLSQGLSSLSFSNLPPTCASAAKTPASASFAGEPHSSRRHAVPHARSADRSSEAHALSSFAFTGIPTLNAGYSLNANPIEADQPPSKKRAFSEEGKENVAEARGSPPRQAAALPEKLKPAPMGQGQGLGLGLGAKSASIGPAPKKASAAAAAAAAKNKPRIGLRRL